MLVLVAARKAGYAPGRVFAARRCDARHSFLPMTTATLQWPLIRLLLTASVLALSAKLAWDVWRG